MVPAPMKPVFSMCSHSLLPAWLNPTGEIYDQEREILPDLPRGSTEEPFSSVSVTTDPSGAFSYLVFLLTALWSMAIL